MGKVCVAGCSTLDIDYLLKTLKSAGKDTVIREGDYISIDGSTGEVISGKLETKPSEVLAVLIDKTLKPGKSKLFQMYNKFMGWVDKNRRLGVRTNADQPDQAENAVAFGAEGIGLCRTEHMFFGGDRIDAVREMILAYDETGRRKALDKILPYQKKDFTEIFRVMKGKPVTIRTLDPPLHEFLPHTDIEISNLAELIGTSIDEIKYKVNALREFNPMLGHRGCRLANTYPEITEMQTRAIFEAAAKVKKEKINVLPEIMIPLVGNEKEFLIQKAIVDRVAKEVMKKEKIKFGYKVGTMIEIPRAAIVAGKIAKDADFFSFGTNDLTQLTYGISRDDSSIFMPFYVEQEIFAKDPFETIDTEGVGVLMEVAVDRGRKVKPNLKMGICGEHGGEPASVEFCHKLGLDYVSCSPFRVPIARLAAARANLME